MICFFMYVRASFVLFYVDSFSYSEIAVISCHKILSSLAQFFYKVEAFVSKIILLTTKA